MFIKEFLNDIIVLLISCVPLLEVKAAIPYALSQKMSITRAIVLTQIGSVLVTLILLLLFNIVIKYLKTTKIFSKLAHKVEALSVKKGKKLHNKIKDESNHMKKIGIMVFGLFVFVAVPLPGTGVWSGSMVACALNIQFRYAFPAIIIGNLVATLLMVQFSSFFFH
jgi:uncharacterized membrane protein